MAEPLKPSPLRLLSWRPSIITLLLLLLGLTPNFAIAETQASTYNLAGGAYQKTIHADPNFPDRCFTDYKPLWSLEQLRKIPVVSISDIVDVYLQQKTPQDAGLVNFPDPVVAVDGYYFSEDGTLSIERKGFTPKIGLNVFRVDLAPGYSLSKYKLGTRLRIIGVALQDRNGDIYIDGACIDDSIAQEQELSIDDYRKIITELSIPNARIRVQKASLKEKKEYGDIILQSAKSMDWDTMKQAVDAGGLINTREEWDHSTALNWVIRSKASIETKLQNMRYLLDRGAIVSSNALGDVLKLDGPIDPLVIELLKHGADPREVERWTNESPYDLAIERKHDRAALIIKLVDDATGGAGIGDGWTQQSTQYLTHLQTSGLGPLNHTPRSTGPQGESPITMLPSGAVAVITTARGRIGVPKWNSTAMKQSPWDMLSGSGTYSVDGGYTKVTGRSLSITIADLDHKAGTDDLLVSFTKYPDHGIKMIRRKAGEAWVNPTDEITGDLSRSGQYASYSYGDVQPGNYAFLVNQNAILIKIIKN